MKPIKDPEPRPNPVPLPGVVREVPEAVQNRVNITEKGPFIQGAPKMIADDFRGQNVDKLQALATVHSQQHGKTAEGAPDFFHEMKDQIQEVDYERNV